MKITLKKAIIITSLGLCLIGLSGLFLAKPIYREIKEWRARQLSEKARQIFEEDELSTEAWESARAAYNLAPQVTEVVRTVARIYSKADPYKALPFWEETINLSDGAYEDRLGLGKAALAVGFLEIAEQQLGYLSQQKVDDPEFLFFKARLFAIQSKIEKAVEVARELVSLSTIPEDAHFFYVQLTQLSKRSELREEGLRYLWELADQQDLLGLSALRNLARASGVLTVDLYEIARRLKSHPQAGRAEDLLRLELLLRLPTTDPDDVLEEAKEYFDTQQVGELVELGRWLNTQKLYAKTTLLISKERALERRDLYLIRIDAMAMMNQWEEIGVYLDLPNVPIESYVRNLFKMRVYLEDDQVRYANLEWDKVLLAVSRDTQKLWYVVDYSLRLNLIIYARAALHKLTEIPTSMRRAYESLVRIEQETGRTVELRDLLEGMGKVYPNEPAVLNDIAYLNLLLGDRVSVSIEKARTMVIENPRYLAHRITLALGYLRIGEKNEALRLLEGLPVNWRSVEARWRVVAAAVYRVNGHLEVAQQIITGIDPEKLLPQERKLLQELM